MQKNIRILPFYSYFLLIIAWEQRKLGEVVSLCSGKDYKHLNIGEIPVYGTGGYMLSVNGALSYTEDAIGIGRKGTINKPYILRAPFWTVDTLFYSIPKSEVNLDFTYSIFQRVNWKKKDESTGVPSLSKVIINTTNITIPTSQEQTKIGAFFKQLDDIIALNNRKYDALKQLKSGYIAQIFSQNLRFSGFLEDWGKSRFLEVANYRNGKPHEQDIEAEGKYIVINSKFVSTNGRVKKYSNTLIEPLKKGELAFVLSDVPNGKAIAKTFLVTEDEKYSLNQRIAGLSPHYNTDSYFLNILMNRNSYFLRFDNGVGQTNLSKSAVENFQEFYPNYDEQVKIGEIFKMFDQIITQQESKINAIKKIKQAYLKKLFV